MEADIKERLATIRSELDRAGEIVGVSSECTVYAVDPANDAGMLLDQALDHLMDAAIIIGANLRQLRRIRRGLRPGGESGT